MQFKIRNYRAVSSIDIELAKIVLLSGKNAAGKTSAIDAIRCAAIGAANPFKEITKKQASMLVHSGTPAGYAEIIEGENVIRIDWPECKASSNGKPVNISEVAAGIVSLADMNSPDRINYIVKMMNANPTEADLAKEMTRLFPPDILISTSDSFARLWENISINGWDNAYKQIREKGRKLKAKWELTTGCKDYGKRIAEQWTPEAWSLDLETIKESELTAGVNKAKEWAEAAIKETAISEHEQKQLKKAAANITLLSSGCDVIEKHTRSNVNSTMLF